MARIPFTVQDSAQRGAITFWRYEVDHSEFTAAATEEVLTIDPIVATSQTFSGGGIILLDAWIQVQTLFAEPAAGAIEMSFGVDGAVGVDCESLIMDADVWQAQNGALNLAGLEVDTKGVLLVNPNDSRADGKTIWVNENVDIEVRLTMAGAATVNQTTAGRATLVVMYIQVPVSD